jgi:hypothetical protein
LSSISATGTTLASVLSISTAHGSGTISFSSITADSSLGAINAPRANLTGPLSLPANAKQINLLSANNSTIMFGGGPPVSLVLQQINNEVINSTAPISQFRVRLAAGITFTAPSISSVQVGGSLLNSTIPLTAAGVDIGNLRVTAAIDSTSILTSGGIGSITAGNIVASAINVAVALPPGETLPSSSAQFTAAASINSVSLRVDTRRPSFANSTIVASRLGTLNLGTIQTANGGIAFGVGARFIRTLTGTDLTSHRSFRLSAVTSSASAAAALAAQRINPQDFNVQIV